MLRNSKQATRRRRRRISLLALAIKTHLPLAWRSLAERATHCALAWRCVLIVSALTPFSSCIAQLPVFARADACAEGPTHQQFAVIERGRLAYVEPASFRTNRRGRSLLVGTPSYVWGRSEIGPTAAKDSLLGLILEANGEMRGLVSPFPGKAIAAVRSAPLADEWWAVVFVEVRAGRRIQDDAVALAMWYGETDGRSWRALAPLPSTKDSLSVEGVSEIAAVNGRLLIAVPAWRGRNKRIVTYERLGSRWTVNSEASPPISYLALGATGTRDILLIVRADSLEARDHNSLFVSTKAPQDTIWRPGSRLVRGEEHPVHHPTVTSQRAGLLVSWLQQDGASRSRSAWFMSLGEYGEVATGPERLAGDVISQANVATGDGAVWALTLDGHSRSPRAALRLEWRTAGQSSGATFESPFKTVLAVSLRDGQLTVTGPRPSASPQEPPVVSMFVTLPWRCR